MHKIRSGEIKVPKGIDVSKYVYENLQKAIREEELDGTWKQFKINSAM